MRQGQHRRPNEPLKARFLRLITSAGQREKRPTDQRAEDTRPSSADRPAVRTHDTAA